MGGKQSNYRLRITETQYRNILKHKEPLRQGDIGLALCGITKNGNQASQNVIFTVHSCFNSTIAMHENDIQSVYEWIERNCKYNEFYLLCFSFGELDDRMNEHFIQNEIIGKTSISNLFLCNIRMDFEDKIWGDIIHYESKKRYPLQSILVVGSDIILYHQIFQNILDSGTEMTLRFDQAFGTKTRKILSSMKVGIVGLSGTGSPVAEMLYRLGVGELVFIDNDRIEKKNLSRMLNASVEDVRNNLYKVDLLKDIYDKIGLDSVIQSIPKKIQSSEAINALAQCDTIFGCMDTHSGRAFLNKLCTFYLIPYFDIGVKLKADGIGGVSEVCGTIHYLEPDGSNLLSRGAINQEKIRAEDMHLEDPEQYDQLRKEKYIQGGNEDSPAVISINTMLSTMAVNDFLARIHPYRNQGNSDIESIAINLCELEFVKSLKSNPAAKPLYVGMGDMVPLLDMPSLSELK